MPPRPPCSALALDVGRKRIGLAGCDPLGLTVTPLPALQRRSPEEDAQTLAALALSRQVELLVVGLPLDASQQLTAQARYSLRYGRLLGWINEFATSWAAAEQFGLKGDRSGKLDSAAAALLLEQWLQEGSVIDPEPLLSSPLPR